MRIQLITLHSNWQYEACMLKEKLYVLIDLNVNYTQKQRVCFIPVYPDHQFSCPVCPHI